MNVKLGFGLLNTKTFWEILSLQPLLLVTTNFTGYTPAAKNALLGFSLEEVVPSPKLQLKAAIAPAELLVKIKLLFFIHCVSELTEYETVGWGFTTTNLLMLSLQPYVEVTISFTV